MNKTAKAFLSILVAILFVAAAIVLVGLPYYGGAVQSGQQIVQLPSMDSGRVALTVSDDVLTVAENNTVSKRLTATVLPESAPDKSVDWSVEWCIPIDGEDVSDYLIVTPDSDGSASALVTALQGFDGASMYVTATTRVGGFSASCLVTYDGAPAFLNVSYNGTTHNNLYQVNVDLGTTTEVTLELTNTLGQVGSKYGSWRIDDISLCGKFNANFQWLLNGPHVVDPDHNVVDVIDLETGKFSVWSSHSDERRTLDIEIDYTDFLEVNLSGNVLTIEAKNNEVSYTYPSHLSYPPRSGNYVSYNSAFYDPRGGGEPMDCFASIFLTETVSGKGFTLNVDLNSVVSGIELDQAELIY